MAATPSYRLVPSRRLPRQLQRRRNQLGYMAEEGWGQPQDYVEALSWFYKAADHGNDDAQENIGYMFQHGTGVQIDYRKAMSGSIKPRGRKQQRRKNQLAGCITSAKGAGRFRKALFLVSPRRRPGQQKWHRNLQALTDILQTKATPPGIRNRSANDAAITQANAASASRISTAASTNSMPTPLNRTPRRPTRTLRQEKRRPRQNLQTPSAPSAPFNNRQQAQKYRAEAGNLRDQLAKPNTNPSLCHRSIPLTQLDRSSQ